MKKKPRVVWCAEDKDKKMFVLVCPTRKIAKSFGKPIKFVEEVEVCRKKS